MCHLTLKLHALTGDKRMRRYQTDSLEELGLGQVKLHDSRRANRSGVKEESLY